MKETKKSLNEKLYDDIKAIILPLDLSGNDILRSYYADTIGKYINNDKKEKDFLERYKPSKLVKLQSPDKLISILLYIQHKFAISLDGITPQDQEAAFEFDTELCSRVATQPIEDHHGCDQAALSSIYTLFDTQRQLCRHYKLSCLKYKILSDHYLNTVVRPFTSKWHLLIKSENYDRQVFRSELNELQVQSREFSSKLKSTFSLVPDSGPSA
ncbi:hypothetical protein [Endozoicomonas sp.]|uniref:hypothetical protein n=1 Tax=Endozoicomonas sp. TaxID=1892382 RepID=UPI00383AB5E9